MLYRRIIDVVALFVLLAFAAPAGAQWLDNPEADVHIHRGIDHVYNLSFDSARAEFFKVVNMDPKHPSGHFFLAMTEWWKIVMDLEDERYDKSFFQMLENVIDLCDERLDKNEDDLVALFFKGGAVGFRGRLYAYREDWVKAANDGRTGLNIIQRAHKLAPNNYDLLLGIGIYNYYAEVVPEQFPFVKPFLIFFPKGDRKKGIEQLRTASEKAAYADIESKYFLAQLFYNFEKRYTEALPLAIDLNRQYPDNVIFHKYVGRLHAAIGHWDEMESVFRSILKNVERNKFGYGLSVEREARYYVGLADMNNGKNEAALAEFFRCDEISRSLEKEEFSGFLVMANLKIGMIYDLQNKRPLAIQQYKKVLEWDEYQRSHEQAERYIKSPYRRD